MKITVKDNFRVVVTPYCCDRAVEEFKNTPK